MSESTDELIVVKLAPMDKEWTLRAIRSVVPAAQYQLQRSYMQLVVGGARGYSMPMRPDIADRFVELLREARVHGGAKWCQSMDRLAAQFLRERYRAAKSNNGNWLPAEKVGFPGGVSRRLCPTCRNPCEPIAMGKAREWYCANCNSYDLPEGEA